MTRKTTYSDSSTTALILLNESKLPGIKTVYQLPHQVLAGTHNKIILCNLTNHAIKEATVACIQEPRKKNRRRVS